MSRRQMGDVVKVRSLVRSIDELRASDAQLSIP